MRIAKRRAASLKRSLAASPALRDSESANTSPQGKSGYLRERWRNRTAGTLVLLTGTCLQDSFWDQSVSQVSNNSLWFESSPRAVGCWRLRPHGRLCRCSWMVGRSSHP